MNMSKLDIDWNKVDKEFKYASQDRDNSIWVWKEAPVLKGDRWMPARSDITDFYMFDRGDIDGYCKEYATNITGRPCDDVKAKSGHKHAESMMLYAQDAAKSSKPWELWECKSDTQGTWHNLYEHPAWDITREYRRKPQTVAIAVSRDVANNFVNACRVGYDADFKKELINAIQEALSNTSE
jgi:hypothetical protein